MNPATKEATALYMGGGVFLGFGVALLTGAWVSIAAGAIGGGAVALVERAMTARRARFMADVPTCMCAARDAQRNTWGDQ